MKRYTLSELQAMPTIMQGHTDDLKVGGDIVPGPRVWLSRLTVADGMEYDNEVTVEALIDGCWVTVDTYPAV